MSVVSTAASSPTRASTPSATPWSTSARSFGPMAPQAEAPARAASTAASASAAPPRATSPIGRSSMGETSVNVVSEATRAPPIQWSVDTSDPFHVDVRARAAPSSVRRRAEPHAPRSFATERYERPRILSSVCVGHMAMSCRTYGGCEIHPSVRWDETDARVGSLR